MEIEQSVYLLAVKDVGRSHNNHLERHTRACPAMTLEEYTEYVKKTLLREFKQDCSRKRRELEQAVDAGDLLEVPIIRKELRLAQARSKAYKALCEGNLI